MPAVSEPGSAFAFQAAVWWNSQGLRKRCGPASWKQAWGYGHSQCQIHITLAGTCSVPFIPCRLFQVNHPLLSSDSNSRSAIWFGFQKEYLVFLFGELILMESLPGELGKWIQIIWWCLRGKSFKFKLYKRSLENLTLYSYFVETTAFHVLFITRFTKLCVYYAKSLHLTILELVIYGSWGPDNEYS